MPVRKKAAQAGSDDELDIRTNDQAVSSNMNKENIAKPKAGPQKKRTKEIDVVPETQDAYAPAASSSDKKRLETKIQILERMNESLEAKFKELYARKHTEPEQALEAFTQIANKRAALATEAQTALVQENAALREDNALLRKGIAPDTHADLEELAQARVELKALRIAVDQVEKQANIAVADADRLHESEKRKWDAKRDRLQDELDSTKKALEDMNRKTLRPLQDEILTLKAELKAEVEHSKFLQAKLKNAPLAPVAPTSSTSDSVVAKLTSDYTDLKTRSELMEDLTGFTVISVRHSADEHVTYSCTFGDYLGEHSVAFKITFGSESDMTYEPDLQPGRDERVIAKLPTKYRSSFRIEADYCSAFFRGLYGAINSVNTLQNDAVNFPVL